ncbi:MAG: hypothetical protein DHS20C18_14140 [Saprospiraceae bacterium]|nr:MAG: hypothetical protein DHS20C18_14140 [Saprospiraceae bacterium]
MISPEEIQQQAENWWSEVLRTSLTGEPFFPRNISRIGKVKTKERLEAFDRIRAQQQALLARCKSQNGQGFTLHWEERNYRNVGRNRFIANISIDSIEDYLHLLRRSTAYHRFLADTKLILETIPQLQSWCVNHPIEIEKLHGKWSDLLKIVCYFRDEHQPGQYYIRELPIPIPTKFIETHRTVLASLLDAILQPNQINEDFQGVKQFEQRYGLKYRQPMVRMRLLDADVGRQYFNGLSDLQIPLDSFTALNLPIYRVIILENKTNYSNLMNFLTLPQLSGTVGLFGSGFGLGKLKDVKWLHHVELLYWGDLDAHGLQILSQLRSYFPHTRSFLMDRDTLDTFSEYVLTDAPESTTTTLAYLTEEEHALFDYLNSNRLRLEQERIPLVYVRERLKIER